MKRWRAQTPKPNDVGFVKAALRGEFTFTFHGLTIRARRVPGMRAPGWLKARYIILCGEADVWERGLREMMEPNVVDWGEARYFDLWADPENGFALWREMCRAAK